MRHLAHSLFSFLFVLTLLGMSGCNDKKGETTDSGKWPETFLASLNDVGKAGQVLCFTVDPIKYYVDSQYKVKVQELIKTCPPGAIYLSSDIEKFERNVLTEFDTVKLRGIVTELQNLVGVPCLFAGNFDEGAWYWDFKTTRFPSPLGLGATGSSSYAYREGKIIAVEAEGQGFNWILSPGINNADSYRGEQNVFQCFSSDPARIGEFAVQFIKGVQDANAAACLKYYPGPESEQENSPGMEPVKSGISAGVMSILCNPFSVSSVSEASSSDASRDVLASEFGFKGVVARAVQGVADSSLSWSSKADKILKSFARGQDMVILPDDPDSILPLLIQLVTIVQLKNIDINTLQPSLKKIVFLKNKLNLHQPSKTSVLFTDGVGIPEFTRTSKEISRASITLLKNEGNILPLDPRNKRLLFANFIDSTCASSGIEFSDDLSKNYPEILQINVLKASDPRIIFELLRRVTESDLLVCTFFLDAGKDGKAPGFSPAQLDLLHKLGKTGKACVGVSFTSPFLINDIPDFKAFLTTYSLYPFALMSASDVLFGKTGTSGKLPLTISAKYPTGSGLEFGPSPQSSVSTGAVSTKSSKKWSVFK